MDGGGLCGETPIKLGRHEVEVIAETASGN